jgi:hypothetical protein
MEHCENLLLRSKAPLFAGRKVQRTKKSHTLNIISQRISVLAGVLLLLTVLPFSQANAQVHNTTQSTQYPTIQAAVNAANPNDVIAIDAGTYNERVTVTKSLTIQGASNTTTIVDGTGLSGAGSGFYINTGITNVTIKNLTVKNFAGTSPNQYAGIYASGGNDNLTVQNTIVKDNVGGAGIYANGPITNVLIDGNDVSGHTAAFGAARGIVIWNGLKSNITVTNNTVYNNNCCGIELQDGTATGVTMTGNNIHDNGDNGMGLIGLSGPAASVISSNTLTNNGRFGIEVKLPAGNGATSGPGSIVISSNTVSRSVSPGSEVRDLAGISVYRRGYVPGNNNVNIPRGVVVSNNNVSGYTQPSNSDGFGIVVEGINHTVTGNTLTGNDVGIQRQAGHTPYTAYTSTDGDQSNLSDTYFGRGNSPSTCGVTVTGNFYSSNGTNTRDVGNTTGTGVVTNTNSGNVFCSIQDAIDDPNTVNGNNLSASAATYNEQVLVNKSVSIKGSGTQQSIINFTGTVSGKPTLFDVSVPNVTLENLKLQVDLTKLSSGIIASGSNVDNLTIKDNAINPYASSSVGSFGSYGNRNAISINYGGGINYRVATSGVNSVSVTGNAVTGLANDGFGVKRYFRSAVSMDEAGGTFSGNTFQSINHDILVRFGSNGPVTITNNNFSGGGVELSEMNNGAGTLTVSNNIFDATLSNVEAANTAVLRLKNAYNTAATNVTGNTFNNHDWAVSLENYRNATLDNNTFTPSASATFRHVTFNTKTISTASSSAAAVATGATLTNNTFNGNGTNGGTALTFFNHSTISSIGTYTIGTAGNENSFKSALGTFIYLDAQSGSSTGATFPPYNSLTNTNPGSITTMAPWSANLSAVNNKFDAGSGLKLPGALALSELFTVEDKITHKLDNSALGFVLVKANNDFVTTNSGSIQRGVDAASAGFTVNVNSGNYTEDVDITTQATLLGAGYGTTTVTGTKNDGTGTTMKISAAGVVIDGFTITRDGNNATDWNGALNSAGVAVQGQTVYGEVRNCYITGNRTGIDVNNSNGNNFHNNIIDYNRTGLIFRNQTDNTSVQNNFITNNWTAGVLFLDASGGSNSPVQTAANSAFNNNNISGNWYGQVVDRQSGGSLPAPGTNLKNFECNWYGTTTPVVTTANSTEPGYAAQIPSAYPGGSATAPGGQPDIAGPASANIDYQPFLTNGTDNSGSIGFQPVPSTITLSSAPGTNTQTKCVNSPITPITYATTNVANVGFSGLPPGVTGSWSGNVATISGSPTSLGTYNYTVTTCSGAATGSITVVANGLSASATVSPLYPMAGQEAQTIYLKYPSSAQADTIKVTATGGTGGYTYSWQKSNCNGSTMSPLMNGGSPVTDSKYAWAPTSADTCSFFGDNVYTFTVTVTDGNGCSNLATLTKKLNVVNAWVGDSGTSNVQICHKVPRSTATQILQVNPSLVASHLGHGDILGNCPVFIGKQILSSEELGEEMHTVFIYPNPTTGVFMLELSEITAEQANITVTDISGKVVQTKSMAKDGPKTATFDMNNYAKGVYLIQVTDGAFVYRDKIIVQ